MRAPLSASGRRRWLLASLAGLVLLVGCGGLPALTGTDLGGQPAPDFTLADQRGAAIRLDAFRGKAVALTFIYTHCPDICPATAEHFREAFQDLTSAQQARVALLAVTVDPARDDRAALQDFSAEHGLAANSAWHALTGSRAVLVPIWRAYGVDPGAMVMASPSPRTGAATAAAMTTLAHTDAIYVIDPQGRERVLLHADLDSAALARDLAALLA
jgi:protein SCO1